MNNEFDVTLNVDGNNSYDMDVPQDEAVDMSLESPINVVVNPTASLPTGGTTGQSLLKASDDDYDAEWGTPSGILPSGGSTGQLLAKSSDSDYSVQWVSAGGGSGDTVVVVASMSGLTITADHTYAELAAAAQADTPIVLLLTDGATEYVCTSCKVYASKISFDLKPQWVDVVGGGVTNLMSYRVDVSADGWEFWVSQSQLTPSDIGAGTYSKPSGGIPKTDLASAVKTSLGKADSAYQKPSGGIPASDLASGVIPTVPSAYTSTPSALGTASAGSATTWAKGDHVHAMPSASDVGAYALPSGGIPATDLASAVQTSLGKADSALQSAPVTSVNSQTGAVVLSIPSTAADVGAIATPASPTVGDFLVYTANGWAAQSLSTWSGGNY